MSGIGWHIFAFGTVIVFLSVLIYRTLGIIRMPVHLRWELAPIPHEKGKGQYGGSYLEEFEWWNNKRQHTRIAPVIYLAKEILLLRGVWKHNRGLWPFSFSLHMGIYLVIVMLILQVVNAILIIAGVSLSVLNVLEAIASVFAAAGFLLGTLGAIGLIIKRTLDANLRPFNTVSRYFKLVFLGAVFISGGYAWLASPDYISQTNLFIKGLLTLDTSAGLSVSLSVHMIISLLFVLYLPLTDMIHFVAKYFTYHEIRWNDTPMNDKMEEELQKLMSRPVTWSATHVKADGTRDWVDVSIEKTKDE